MKLDSISPEDVMHSFDLSLNRQAVFKAGQGAGRSGSFFFSSHDKRFIIKTLRGSEKKHLLSLIDHMVEYFESN